MSSEADNLRIVIDTNQVVSAGSAWLEPTPAPKNISQKLIYLVATTHDGLYSSEIMGEYVEKLIDTNHPRERISLFVTYIMRFFTRVVVTTKSCRPAPSDTDDVMFILCALDGKADFLVTDDNHLLDLRDHYRKPKIREVNEFALELGII